MNTSKLMQDLAPLNAQIEQAREKLGRLEDELHAAEAKLDVLAAEEKRFDALQDVCQALDRLGELDGVGLFWEGVPGADDAAVHLERLRGRIAIFAGEVQGARERQELLKAQVDDVLDELDYLDDEVRQAHAREERRQEEFVIVREISQVPYRLTVMPWTSEGESESRYRRAMLVALILSMLLGYLVPLITVPVPDRSAAVIEIPERLAMLVKKEPPKPEPVKPKEEKKVEPDQPAAEKPKEAQEREQPKPTPVETQTARKKAESTGILAFKNSFADLMEDVPVAKLGTQSLTNDARSAGQATRATRSLVAIQGQGGSGGISNAGVSRNIGSGNADRLGGSGVGFARVESAVAGLAEEARPLSSGPGPARTDEEIQIVFDRYKAALYRIYNTELRKNPTLRGKMLLRLTIEPGGEVSMCTVESTDLASPELVAQIVDRVRKFNFGPKEDVPKTTILYPIDFLPAG